MSQQEFERPWQQNEALPKDEPPGAYDMPEGRAAYQNEQQMGQAQVPWWARPQPQRFNGTGFIVLMVMAILIIAITGGLGVVGVVLGSLLHVLGVILGAIFALLIFVLALTFFVVAMVWRAVGRTMGTPRIYDRQARRMVRRTARRYGRGRWY